MAGELSASTLLPDQARGWPNRVLFCMTVSRFYEKEIGATDAQRSEETRNQVRPGLPEHCGFRSTIDIIQYGRVEPIRQEWATIDEVCLVACTGNTTTST